MQRYRQRKVLEEKHYAQCVCVMIEWWLLNNAVMQVGGWGNNEKHSWSVYKERMKGSVTDAIASGFGQCDGSVNRAVESNRWCVFVDVVYVVYVEVFDAFCFFPFANPKGLSLHNR